MASDRDPARACRYRLSRNGTSMTGRAASVSRCLSTPRPLTEIFIYFIIILMMNVTKKVPLLLLREGPPIRRIPLALARRFFQICTSACAEAVTEADLTPLEFAVMAYVNSTD